MSAVNDVRVGVLGLGTVGAGVVKILQTRAAMLQERTGARLSLAAVADTDLTRPREGLDLATLPMTGDAARVLADPSIHVVVELVGGLEPADGVWGHRKRGARGEGAREHWTGPRNS